MFKKLLSSTIIICFFLSSLGPYPQAHADTVLNLPTPGNMINLSPAYEPVMIKGLTVHKDNPFLFDFIVDVGQDKMSGQPLKKEGEKLIKYFLASLAIPDKDVWVNLSPYEKNRMIPQALGQTDMGRDLLEQDYILKQITASLIYPEKQLGRTFWNKVYTEAQEKFGTTQIPVNTFNKVWIMADRAEVFEHGQTAFVVDSHLKVMLEEDYLALSHHVIPAKAGIQNRINSDNGSPIKTFGDDKSNSIASNIIRQIILPELEHEVNTGKNFANLRQIFNSIILSSWYKKRLKTALLNQVYADKSRVKGIMRSDVILSAAKDHKRSLDSSASPQNDVDVIYEQYLKAYKKGVFNYIKDDINVTNGQAIPRKYFSGGINEAMAADPAMTHDIATLQPIERGQEAGNLMNITTLASTNAAMATFIRDNTEVNRILTPFVIGQVLTRQDVKILGKVLLVYKIYFDMAGNKGRRLIVIQKVLEEGKVLEIALLNARNFNGSKGLGQYTGGGQFFLGYRGQTIGIDRVEEIIEKLRNYHARDTSDQRFLNEIQLIIQSRLNYKPTEAQHNPQIRLGDLLPSQESSGAAASAAMTALSNIVSEETAMEQIRRNLANVVVNDDTDTVILLRADTNSTDYQTLIEELAAQSVGLESNEVSFDPEAKISPYSWSVKRPVRMTTADFKAKINSLRDLVSKAMTAEDRIVTDENMYELGKFERNGETRQFKSLRISLNKYNKEGAITWTLGIGTKFEDRPIEIILGSDEKKAKEIFNDPYIAQVISKFVIEHINRINDPQLQLWVAEVVQLMLEASELAKEPSYKKKFNLLRVLGQLMVDLKVIASRQERMKGIYYDNDFVYGRLPTALTATIGDEAAEELELVCKNLGLLRSKNLNNFYFQSPFKRGETPQPEEKAKKAASVLAEYLYRRFKAIANSLNLDESTRELLLAGQEASPLQISKDKMPVLGGISPVLMANNVSYNEPAISYETLVQMLKDIDKPEWSKDRFKILGNILICQHQIMQRGTDKIASVDVYIYQIDKKNRTLRSLGVFPEIPLSSKDIKLGIYQTPDGKVYIVRLDKIDNEKQSLSIVKVSRNEPLALAKFKPDFTSNAHTYVPGSDKVQNWIIKTDTLKIDPVTGAWMAEFPNGTVTPIKKLAGDDKAMTVSDAKVMLNTINGFFADIRKPYHLSLVLLDRRVSTDLGKIPDQLVLRPGPSPHPKVISLILGRFFKLTQSEQDELEFDLNFAYEQNGMTIPDLPDYIIKAIKNGAFDRPDFAMESAKYSSSNQPWRHGGIDLNTTNGMQWKISKDGQGVQMDIDPAMIARIRREGIDSLSPVILRMTPVKSIWPMVGLQDPALA